MSAEEDVAKAAPLVIGVAAAACSVIPGIGTGVCAAGAAAAAALTAAGIAISEDLRDKFHPPKAASEALLTIIRLCPPVLFIGHGGIDNVGAPHEAADLVLYLLATSGEVPTGVAGNTGKLRNPDNNACNENPFLCGPYALEPLSDEVTLNALHAAFLAWQRSGSPLSTFASAVLTPYNDPKAAAELLSLIRLAPAPFLDVLQWEFAQKAKEQIREAVRAARARAGEADPSEALSALFGDVTPAAAASPATATTLPATAASAPSAAPSPLAPAAQVTGGVPGREAHRMPQRTGPARGAPGRETHVQPQRRVPAGGAPRHEAQGMSQHRAPRAPVSQPSAPAGAALGSAMPGVSLQRALAVKDRLKRQLRGASWFRGIGVAQTATGYVIQVNIASLGVRAELPAAVEGVPIVQELVAPALAQTGGVDQAEPSRAGALVAAGLLLVGVGLVATLAPPRFGG